jgi:hypothetical protein
MATVVNRGGARAPQGPTPQKKQIVLLAGLLVVLIAAVAFGIGEYVRTHPPSGGPTATDLENQAEARLTPERREAKARAEEAANTEATAASGTDKEGSGN